MKKLEELEKVFLRKQRTSWTQKKIKVLRAGSYLYKLSQNFVTCSSVGNKHLT